jgi:hypothetical protein
MAWHDNDTGIARASEKLSRAMPNAASRLSSDLSCMKCRRENIPGIDLLNA